MDDVGQYFRDKRLKTRVPWIDRKLNNGSHNEVFPTVGILLKKRLRGTGNVHWK
jgi:hypothetical protein